MALWMMRAPNSEDEAAALQQGLAILGFTKVPNLGTPRNFKEFQLLCQRALAGESTTAIARSSNQLWAFRSRLKQGDLILSPRHKRGGVAIGKVTGPYEYRAGLPGGSRHVRPVEWIRREIPRSLFEEDLLLSLSTAASIASIRKRDGEERVRALAGLEAPDKLGSAAATTEMEDEGYGIHFEESARDQVRLRIQQRFGGQELTVLVDGLLQAQGYRTHHMPAGGDGAVLIMAGRGPMGLEPPRLCVQVCVGPAPEDPNTVKDFQAAVKNHGADQGLLIAWRGFQGVAVDDSQKRFFELRLWDDEDLIDAVVAAYEELPPAVRSALRLRRVWVPMD